MSNRNRSAFTLIELLIVIAIMAILIGLLLSGIGAAYRMVRKTKANTEVKSIASALEFYYSEYHKWPPGLGINPEANAVEIKGDIATILQGENSIPGLQSNPKKIQFVQFKTFLDGNPTNQPINPWWTSGTTNDCAYYLKVDNNFDNVIDKGTPLPTVVWRHRVLVWTMNYDNGQYILSSD